MSDGRPGGPARRRFDGLDAVACVTGAPGHFPREAVGDEESLLAGITGVRRSQFIAARGAARAALADFGFPHAAILRLPGGAPDWPTGIVGSLAHCEGLVAAAAASAQRWRALGIDVEPDLALPADAARVAITDDERVLRPGIAGEGLGEDFARLVFCAKECVHKCLNPLLGVWLEFDEVAIHVDVAARAFLPVPRSAAARGAFNGLRLEGRWQREAGFVLAILAAA